MSKINQLFRVALYFLIFVSINKAQSGEYKHLVNKIEGQTNTGMSIKLWTDTPRIKFGDLLKIQIEIKNSSKRNVFLVFDRKDELIFDKDKIVVPRPLVLLGGEEPYDYKFIRLKKGENYRKQIQVSSNKVANSGIYYFLFGFGYVTDINDLSSNPLKDPIHQKSTLQSRLATFQFGQLKILFY